MTEEERMDAANYIFKEGKRLEALSFKLLDLMVLRHQELAKRRVSTEWLAEEIRGILEPVLEKQEIRLWVSVEDRQVELEPDLMKTVLMNLLDNGRKAMEGSGREKRLTLLGRPEQGGYAFYVCDTGKGVPEAELSRITEAFYMVDKSRSRKQGGAGLGLSICCLLYTSYTFYDGPPTANGKPHIGHVLTRVIKDMIPRYQTMKGHKIIRKAGWDTHGLPVELEVEKMLGLDGKEQIEEYGMEPFIKKCKESVWKYKGMWEDFSDTVGFWADMENPCLLYTSRCV